MLTLKKIQRTRFMKYRTALLLLACSQILSKSEKTSQTFMYYRPLSQNAAAVGQVWNQIVARKDNSNQAAFQIIGLYQQSHNFRTSRFDDIGSYFLLNCKNEILVAGDDTEFITTRDVRAEWLNLPSNFSGRLSLAPHQQQAGVILSFNQDLKRYVSWKLFEAWWIDLRMPIYMVKNNLCAQQTTIQNPGSAPFNTDIISALSSYKFAAINNRTKHKAGPSELAIAIGTTFLDHDDFVLTYQTAFCIPLTGKQKPDELFNAFLGGNGHVGMRYQFYFEMPLHEKCSEFKALFFLNMEDHYYFKAHEWRTFDLWNKQWSRYMPLRNIRTGEVVQGVDVLTQQVCVKPHNFFDMSAGFKFSHCGVEFEIGYDLWVHPSEQILLGCRCCEKVEPLIRSYGIAGANGGTANESTITTLAADDLVPTPLFVNDIQPLSGAGRSGFTNKFHIAAAYRYDGHIPVSVGLGGFYEKPHTNTALEQWGVWGKIISEF